MISKYERSKKAATELDIFRGLTKLTNIMYSTIKNAPKDIKMTYGYHVLNVIPKCIELVRAAWGEKDKSLIYAA